MNRVYAIALTAFREAIRDRILFAVLGLGAALVCLGLGMGALSTGDTTRIVVDQGLATISVLSNLVAIFLGANFLYKELELRTLYVLLAKPVARHEVVLGKFTGVLVTVAVFIAVTASVLLVLVTLTAAEESVASITRAQHVLGVGYQLARSRGVRLAALVGVFAIGPVALIVPAVRRRLTIGTVLPITLAFFAVLATMAHAVEPRETEFVLSGCALVLCEVMITAAFSMLFSSFSTPFVTGLMSAGVFAICRSTWLMQHIHVRNFPETARLMLETLARVVPNLHLFVPERAVLSPEIPSASIALYAAELALYAGGYAGLLLFASSLLFRRRDLL